MSATRRYYAACTLGLEQALRQELEALDAAGVEVRRGGCEFRGDRALGYRACLWLRCAVRVQEELAEGRVRGRDDLYRLAQQVDWSRSITALQTLAVDASVKDSFANDTRFPALVVKDAVCDQFRSRDGRRPDVDRDRPDLPIKLVLQGERAVLYRDLGGAPLHKRGYREIQHKSPLNEALAAGLLLLTDWDHQEPLCDPMCGSATLLVEAAFLATDRAPGLARSFAFERFADADLPAWRAIYDDAEGRAQRGLARCPPLFGNDRHPGALSIAAHAITRAGLDGRVRVQRGDVGDWTPPVPPAMVVTNPPYGERLDAAPAALADDWRALGRFLHARCGAARAYVLSGNPELTRHLGLRADRKWPVRNGPIECRWIRYAIDAPATERR
ncbi:MAG: class I SAM-dependent RNA methyltransferase [Planctomycetota bacterium]